MRREKLALLPAVVKEERLPLRLLVSHKLTDYTAYKGYTPAEPTNPVQVYQREKQSLDRTLRQQERLLRDLLYYHKVLNSELTEWERDCVHVFPTMTDSVTLSMEQAYEVLQIFREGMETTATLTIEKAKRLINDLERDYRANWSIWSRSRRSSSP